MEAWFILGLALLVLLLLIYVANRRVESSDAEYNNNYNSDKPGAWSLNEETKTEVKVEEAPVAKKKAATKKKPAAKKSSKK